MEHYTESLDRIISMGAEVRNKLRDLLDAENKACQVIFTMTANALLIQWIFWKNLFIVNNDNQVAMLNSNGKLESW